MVLNHFLIIMFMPFLTGEKMINVDSLDYTQTKPYVYFWYKGVEMEAELDPCVKKPVVIKGTARGCEVDIVFNKYEDLQREINLFV